MPWLGVFHGVQGDEALSSSRRYPVAMSYYARMDSCPFTFRYADFFTQNQGSPYPLRLSQPALLFLLPYSFPPVAPQICW